MRRDIGQGDQPLTPADVVAVLRLYNGDDAEDQHATAVIWLAGAVIGDDLVLLPLHTLGDRPPNGLARRRARATTALALTRRPDRSGPDLGPRVPA